MFEPGDVLYYYGNKCWICIVVDVTPDCVRAKNISSPFIPSGREFALVVEAWEKLTITTWTKRRYGI